MPDISPAPRPSDPIQTIVDSVTVAILQGHRVTADPYPGVVLASTYVPSWERDPQSETISALGAVLLVKQPAIPDLDAALEKTLGVGPGWIVGFERGVLGHKLDARLAVRPDARLIEQGMVAGMELRARLHVRRLGAPLKLDKGPAQGLIEQLLDTLSTSQLLEKTADSCHGRIAGLTPELADAMRTVEEVLRNLAEIMRRPGMGV